MWYLGKRLRYALLALLAILLPALLWRGGVRQAGGMQEPVPLPILMYHHILEEESGQLGDYVISPGQFESDMAFLKRSGYTTVLPREVVAYVKGEGELPECPVMVTFDDGNKSTYVYAFPILERLGMKAALAVIGIHSEQYSLTADGNVSYAHANWEDLSAMQRSGLIEIGSHTYDLHDLGPARRGTLRNPGESRESYQRLLYDDLRLNQQLLAAATGETPCFFAYPYGFIDPDADEVLGQLGFGLTLGVAERVDSIRQGDPDSLKKLGRFNRPHSADTEAFIGAILSQAGENKAR